VSADQITAAFTAWWQASYPNAPASPRTIELVVAFVQHLLSTEDT
jgi:hypothetical protein